MASFMSYFVGRRDPKQSARDAIVTLRQQLQMIEKEEEHLQKLIRDEVNTARTNAVSNKNGELIHVLVKRLPLAGLRFHACGMLVCPYP